MKRNFQCAVRAIGACAMAALVGAATPAAARTQEPADSVRTGLVRVFAECDVCETDYLRQQLTFVNLVRDRRLADVHVLVTSLASGGGGRQYTIELTGRAPGVPGGGVRTDTVRVNARLDATDVEARELVVRAIKVALLPFLRDTESFARLDLVSVAPPGADAGTARGEHDRWNGWLYRINGGGNVDGDDNYASRQGNLDVSAAQTTERRKMVLSAGGEYRKTKYRLEDDRAITAHQRSWFVQGLLVHSITDRMSAGVVANARSSLFGNTTLATRTAAGIEYNLIPYREATQRQALALYTVGVRSARYVDTTIYGRVRETRPLHTLTLSTEYRRPWGSLFVVGESSQYLHDASKYRIAVDGGFDWRIARGLTLGAYASYAVTRDQLNIAGTGLTDENRLLRLRELQSGSSFQTSVHASYGFGSLFNNVVNPRMRRF